MSFLIIVGLVLVVAIGLGVVYDSRARRRGKRISAPGDQAMTGNQFQMLGRKSDFDGREHHRDRKP